MLNTNAEISKIVKENYLVVLIDVDKGHNADVVKQFLRAHHGKANPAKTAAPSRASNPTCTMPPDLNSFSILITSLSSSRFRPNWYEVPMSTASPCGSGSDNAISKR